MICRSIQPQGAELPTHLVNLDALIKRADFEESSGATHNSKRVTEEIKLDDLARAYLNLLRKPDFQRETSNWDAEKIVDFIRSFLDGDVIPSIIMWMSDVSPNVFVIDGSHRLSALMAWVHDDYGSGNISQQFWNHSIPVAQQRIATQTRTVVESQIGSYQALKQISEGTAAARDDEMTRRARNMATYKIDIQWVGGNAASAEKSFFKINGSPSVIDPTELGLIKARKKPNAIATRALMNSGTGHKYWHRFPDKTGKEIEALSKEIYGALFEPLLQTPIKTTDLPIAGQGYSATAFRMVFDLVNMVNDVTPQCGRRKQQRRKRQTQPQYCQTMKRVMQLSII